MQQFTPFHSNLCEHWTHRQFNRLHFISSVILNFSAHETIYNFRMEDCQWFEIVASELDFFCGLFWLMNAAVVAGVSVRLWALLPHTDHTEQQTQAQNRCRCCVPIESGAQLMFLTGTGHKFLQMQWVLCLTLLSNIRGHRPEHVAASMKFVHQGAVLFQCTSACAETQNTTNFDFH